MVMGALIEHFNIHKMLIKVTIRSNYYFFVLNINHLFGTVCPLITIRPQHLSLHFVPTIKIEQHDFVQPNLLLHWFNFDECNCHTRLHPQPNVSTLSPSVFIRGDLMLKTLYTNQHVNRCKYSCGK